jgi:transcriptional regulator with AAA-type ATPase domain/tetratricopeptide (TPR) repeat protein
VSDTVLQRVGASLIVTLFADRFLRYHDSWIDISTAEPVTLATRPAGSLRQQIGWAEHCSMLSRLRHPLLNPLIDYGAADATSFFEAYSVQDPITTTSVRASRFKRHADRFLQGHGIGLSEAADAPVYRQLRRAVTGVRGRPVGFALQPRRAYLAVSELLATSRRGGVTTATIAGPTGSGLRTLLLTIAQMARTEGYVPVCPAAVQQWPAVLDDLYGRHVCVIARADTTPAQRSIVALLLARLGRRSARSHLLILVNRAERPLRGALHLEPMGITSMTSMLYVDREYGPSPDDVFEAARHSDGLPARFLARLGTRSFASTMRVFTVHESPVPYGSPSTDVLASLAPKRSRIGSVLWRASRRAADLESHGRHAAAARLLIRAARVLEGRGDTAEAAHCWTQLAWIARSRGVIARALEYAERAGQADGTAGGQAQAGLVIATCWTDEARFIEAEASLRNLTAATSTIGATVLHADCALALARVLCWDGKGHDALAALDSISAADDLAVRCQVFIRRAKAHLQLRDLRSAIQAAREGSKLAAESRNRRLEVSAHIATAEALAAAGDLEGVRVQVRAGIVAASQAHLPLAALRLRAILLPAIRANSSPRGDGERLRALLQRALRHPLPLLIRRLLSAACDESANHDRSSVRGFGSRTPPARVEDFLEIAQRASDDATAVGEVLNSLCERIGAASAALVAAPDSRILATAGKQWREKPAAAIRAASSGQSVSADGSSAPAEAGEPVRCGGALLAAIGCRWLLGAVVIPELVAPVMRAAGLAIATHVRALVDTLPIEPPPGVWNDLIGESAMAVALRESAQRASRAPFPVLIEGESGSGKELVARAIHRLSVRHTRRFCAINCAALSDELVEAELFGHTRGAFTGATAERAGLFEEADGGTLFLDEVGELSARAQAKLLRALQEGEVRRVGENLPRRVDVRIIAATNRRLEDEAAHGRFRTDLRFRLDVLRIVVPPLRERVADIPMLAQHFWRQAAARVGSQATLGPEALAALSRYDWPGNVRELQNAIAWLAVHAPRRGRVAAGTLPAQLASSPMATGSFEAAREEFERRYVRAALAQAGGQRQAAAKALGVSRQGFAKMLRRLGIDG